MLKSEACRHEVRNHVEVGYTQEACCLECFSIQRGGACDDAGCQEFSAC
jgi:hypothetical protein